MRILCMRVCVCVCVFARPGNFLVTSLFVWECDCIVVVVAVILPATWHNAEKKKQKPKELRSWLLLVWLWLDLRFSCSSVIIQCASCLLIVYLCKPIQLQVGSKGYGERERAREWEGEGVRVTWGKYGERESWRKQGKLAEIWARKAAHIVWLKTFLQVDGFSQKIKREWGRVDRDTMSR